MSEKTPKSKYILDDESVDEELIEEVIEEEPEKLSGKELEEHLKEIEEMKKRRKLEKEEKEESKKIHKKNIENSLLKFLRKGKVMSKRDLTHLLIKDGIKDYYFKINLIQNQMNLEIPHIGSVLKRLRFENKVNFSIYNGAHVYFTNFDSRTLKPKAPKIDFDWKKYKIPQGKNEIYVAFKVPGSSKKSFHLLASCFPSAKFAGFTINVDRKYETNHSFTIFKGVLEGFFDADKLILKCYTTGENVNKTLFTIIQIGRRLVEELLKLNMRYSEILTIINQDNTAFIPVVPIFRDIERGAFYDTKYTNAIRNIYDFPKKYEGKLIYGNFSLISNEIKDEEFNLTDLYNFIDDGFEFQIKAFLSNAIMQDWIINPTKALNYMDEDEELAKLVKEYLQDIDTDRIIQEKIEESMEKSEFFKDITTNLLLTLLGLSLLAQNAIFQWILIGFFVLINVYYFYLRTKKSKKKMF
ncbi:MAG: hypothetical protein ACFE85_08555 [Candidatus Hodarchaeota archaeon]